MRVNIKDTKVIGNRNNPEHCGVERSMVGNNIIGMGMNQVSLVWVPEPILSKPVLELSL